MLTTALLFSLLATTAPGDDPAKPPRLSAAAFDEDEVAGHPDGEPPPLPKNVDWSLDKSQVAATSRRRRLTLAGPWRFAAMSVPDVSPQRAEMGWLKMPAAAPAQWDISDKTQKASRGQWNGKPLAGYSYAWCERVLDAPVQWVNYQVFLVIRGPWSQADLFVAYAPVPGIEKPDGRWFEITEALVYGGEAPLALRLKDPSQVDAEVAKAEPFIGVELLPTGPRFDGLSVKQDPQRKELEVSLDLRRPKFILGLPVRLSEISFIVQFSYDDATNGSVIYRFDQNIGPMPDDYRGLSLRLPWSKQDAPPPDKARLRARLTSIYGGNMDIAYPLEFSPARLEHVESNEP
jgi:hypothetical protein